MPDIYTEEWYAAVRDAVNERIDGMDGVPEGTWYVAIDVVGDARSPYVGHTDERNFLVLIEGGRCAWYRELDAENEGPGSDGRLDFRFRGPASVFDEIAAGLLDPIDAALQGRVEVRGDMRFLMRQAEHVQVLLEAYSNGVDTRWPNGKPPYGVAEVTR
jgi:putative sterol carrier protein